MSADTWQEKATIAKWDGDFLVLTQAANLRPAIEQATNGLINLSIYTTDTQYRIIQGGILSREELAQPGSRRQIGILHEPRRRGHTWGNAQIQYRTAQVRPNPPSESNPGVTSASVDLYVRSGDTGYVMTIQGIRGIKKDVGAFH